MSVTTLISVEEYLRTSYSDGDREYIDGRVVERNVGTIDHAHWQTRMAVFLLSNYPALWTAVAVRVQVRPTRVRIPDVTCIWGPKPESSIIHEPPFLVIEVLSPDDRDQRNPRSGHRRARGDVGGPSRARERAPPRG